MFRATLLLIKKQISFLFQRPSLLDLVGEIISTPVDHEETLEALTWGGEGGRHRKPLHAPITKHSRGKEK